MWGGEPYEDLFFVCVFYNTFICIMNVYNKQSIIGFENSLTNKHEKYNITYWKT